MNADKIIQSWISSQNHNPPSQFTISQTIQPQFSIFTDLKVKLPPRMSTQLVDITLNQAIIAKNSLDLIDDTLGKYSIFYENYIEYGIVPTFNGVSVNSVIDFLDTKIQELVLRFFSLVDLRYLFGDHMVEYYSGRSMYMLLNQHIKAELVILALMVVEVPKSWLDNVQFAPVIELLKNKESIRSILELKQEVPSVEDIKRMRKLASKAVIRQELENPETAQTTSKASHTTDPVRFFTQDELKKVLLRRGFSIETVSEVILELQMGSFDFAAT